MTQTVTPAGASTRGTPGKTNRRLRLLQVLILAIGVTIGVRLVWVQSAMAPEMSQQAAAIQSDVVEIAPARGEIVDRNGVIIAGNRTAYEVRVDDDERETLDRIAELAGADVEDLRARTAICGQPGAKAGTCFQGVPGQPMPVLTDVPVAQALAVRDADLPGVSVAKAAVRDYPSDVNLAQVLGYTTAGEGRSGLEAQYDEALRGVAGQARRELTRQGQSAVEVTEPAQPGATLRTTLDVRTQKAAEKALRRSVSSARAEGYRARGGSVVVMDARNGEILAMASYPTYDPNIWAHGVSDTEYAELTADDAGEPLVLRPVQGLAPPASTFKSLTTLAAAQAGYDLQGTYDCPSSVSVGGRQFRNYDSRGYGTVSLDDALSLSCDTVFYRMGYQMWKRDGGLGGDGAEELVVNTARDFGLGRKTGIDLPGESAGSVPDRADVLGEYESRKQDYCRRAKTGYPEESNRARARLLKAYARDYCRSGGEYKAGDAMNTAIGQGRTLVTPLQMAVAYAAIANGGTLVTPHLGQKSPGSDADLSSADADPQALAFVRQALAETSTTGTARWAFQGFPLDQFPVAAKTGTAEVAGKQSTSWFASFAPADDPKYVVVVNVDQGGLGAATSGPVARAVYEQLFGVS